jgi:hypothetical protein
MPAETQNNLQQFDSIKIERKGAPPIFNGAPRDLQTPARRRP